MIAYTYVESTPINELTSVNKLSSVVERFLKDNNFKKDTDFHYLAESEFMKEDKMPIGYKTTDNIDKMNKINKYDLHRDYKLNATVDVVKSERKIPWVSDNLFVSNDTDLYQSEMKDVVKDFYGRTNERDASVYLDGTKKGTEILGYEIDSIPELEDYIGPNDIIAFNPDLYNMPREIKESASKHEWVHHYTEGKTPISLIGARTIYGDIPLGTMLVEGATEYLLEKSGHRRPSEVMKNLTNQTPLYDIYFRMVDELENSEPGILSKIHNISDDAINFFGDEGYIIGAMNVVRELEDVPDINNIIDKYSRELYIYQRRN